MWPEQVTSAVHASVFSLVNENPTVY
jgi:hypothetical protein